jgi:hypothetical protein
MIDLLIELYTLRCKVRDLSDECKYGDSMVYYNIVREKECELFTIIIPDIDKRNKLICEFNNKGMSIYDLYRDIINKFISSEYNYIPKVTFDTIISERPYLREEYKRNDSYNTICPYKLMVLFLTEIKINRRNDTIDNILI